MVRSSPILLLCVNAVGCREANELPPPLGAENIPVRFKTDNGWEYDGRIELPPEASRNSYAVMMIGGGAGSPIGWEVPGDFTFDGKPVHAGDTIAKALLDAGFAVMRWQAIRRDDPKYARGGPEFEAPPFTQTVEQAKKALAAFREKNVVPDDHVFFLGHSLGAKRAAILLDEIPQAPGMVLLSGAALVPADLDDIKRIANGIEPDAPDRHEAVVAAMDRQQERWLRPSAAKQGFRWSFDSIVEHKTPVLLIAGAADESALLESYVFMWHMRDRAHPACTWSVYEAVGHYLDRKPDTEDKMKRREYAKLVGPVDEQVVRDIVQWLRRLADERSGPEAAGTQESP